MSNTNILNPLIDSCFDSLKVLKKGLYKVLNIRENFDMENFFKAVNLKNSSDEYPKQKSITENDKTINYFLEIPRGLSIKDFNKYQEAIELQLGKDICINYYTKRTLVITIWKEPIDKDFNFKKFFKAIDMKNKQDEYPIFLSKRNGSRGIIYKFHIPYGISKSDFIKHQEALELQLGYSIDIRLINGCIEIETIETTLDTKINYKEPTKIKESLYIPYAESVDGTLYLDLKETPHTLCTGATGSGKSITTRSILSSLISMYANDIELYLIDFKIVELSIFENLKMTKCYVNEVDEAKEVIADLMAECKRRYQLFKSVGVTDIYNYNKKVSKDKQLKMQFIVIEEFIMLLEDKKKIAMTNLKKLASLSRASGQFLYITAQRFDNTVIDLVLRSNIGNRLCHKVESENDSKLIIDTVGAEKLRGQGHMLAKTNGKVVEAQGYYISDNQIKEIIHPYIENKAVEEPQTALKLINDKSIVKDIQSQNKGNYEVAVTNNIEDLSFLDKL